MFTKWFKDPGSGLFTDNSELTGLYVGGVKSISHCIPISCLLKD